MAPVHAGGEMQSWQSLLVWETTKFIETWKIFCNIFKENILLLESPAIRSGNNYHYAGIWFQLFQKNYSATIFATTRAISLSNYKKWRGMMEEKKKKKQYITLLSSLLQELVYKEGIFYIFKSFNWLTFPKKEWVSFNLPYSPLICGAFGSRNQNFPNTDVLQPMHIRSICSLILWVQSWSSGVSKELWLLMYPALAQCHATSPSGD